MKLRTNILLGTAPIPGGGELRLYQRGAQHVIEVAGTQGELMTSEHHASEDALAELALARHPKAATVLVGGLGMGHTLAAALRNAGPKAQVVVAELVPEVVEWNKEHVGEHAGHPLRDPRVVVHVGDVLELIRAGRAAYDIILLDTDNGPEGFTRKDNDRLYSHRGLDSLWKSLRPGGILAVWSTHPHPPFTKRMGMAGFRVDERSVFAHGTKGTRHHLWFGQKA